MHSRFLRTALAMRPSGLWMCDDVYGLSDLSGNGNDGTAQGDLNVGDQCNVEPTITAPSIAAKVVSEKQHVKAHGAVGAGESDDLTALQAAVDAAADHLSGTVGEVYLDECEDAYGFSPRDGQLDLASELRITGPGPLRIIDLANYPKNLRPSRFVVAPSGTDDLTLDGVRFEGHGDEITFATAEVAIATTTAAITLTVRNIVGVFPQEFEGRALTDPGGQFSYEGWTDNGDDTITFTGVDFFRPVDIDVPEGSACNEFVGELTCIGFRVEGPPAGQTNGGLRLSGCSWDHWPGPQTSLVGITDFRIQDLTFNHGYRGGVILFENCARGVILDTVARDNHDDCIALQSLAGTSQDVLSPCEEIEILGGDLHEADSDTQATNNGIVLSGARHIRVEGVNVDGAGSLVSSNKSCLKITRVRNNRAVANVGADEIVFEPHDIEVSNFVFRNSRQYGVFLTRAAAASNICVTDGLIADCSWEAIRCGAAADEGGDDEDEGFADPVTDFTADNVRLSGLRIERPIRSGTGTHLDAINVLDQSHITRLRIGHITHSDPDANARDLLHVEGDSSGAVGPFSARGDSVSGDLVALGGSGAIASIVAPLAFERSRPMLFDGTGDFTITTYQPFVQDTARTFIGLAYRRDTGATHTLLGDDGVGSGVQLALLVNRDVRFRPDFSSATGQVIWGEVFPTAELVCWGFEANDPDDTAALYLNGSLVSEQAWTGQFIEGTNLRVGATVQAQGFDGYMGPFLAFERALSSSEHLRIAKAMIAGLT